MRLWVRYSTAWRAPRTATPKQVASAPGCLPLLHRTAESKCSRKVPIRLNFSETGSSTPSGAPSSYSPGTPLRRCVPGNAPRARSLRAGSRTAPPARGGWFTKRPEELLSRRRSLLGSDIRGCECSGKDRQWLVSARACRCVPARQRRASFGGTTLRPAPRHRSAATRCLDLRHAARRQRATSYREATPQPGAAGRSGAGGRGFLGCPARH
jgi:hypothetical protein